MPNPYMSLPYTHYWKTAVSDRRDQLRVSMQKTFCISPHDKIVTAGSCFAQHLSHHLSNSPRANLLIAENITASDPFFSARYGNIYTAHQLLGLLDECEDGIVDDACAIQRDDGRWVDMHRPFIKKDGHTSEVEVITARKAHITAARNAFYSADVFVFTLGLTEAWRSTDTGRVLPSCPGIYSEIPEQLYEFVNFGFSATKAALIQFSDRLAALNPNCRLLVTVSPVPLTATYTEDHVRAATRHSKSILRAVCGEFTTDTEHAYYFPSYEMVANSYTQGSAFSPSNLREVDVSAVQSVMDLFDATYLTAEAEAPIKAGKAEISPYPKTLSPEDDDLFCDDVQIEKSIGF